MKTKNNKEGSDKIRLIAIIIVSLFVIVTGTLFSLKSFIGGNVAGGAGGIFIVVTILVFAISVFIRGNSDIKKGFPLQDERSKRVMEKATSRAFYISLYMLLAVGFLSEDLIKFRDVSQATSVTVGLMSILFAVCWVYYNRKGDLE
ncbi:MAG: hypothetical protein COY38_04905 [Candidatus Aenigmarchaeota archaeon CG_4_10_14_0_8_um_filter_37_24]|nr:DUF2178 domain-containing protein [Candidatus Aenigmarchaeota archaeon]OIN88095.1 MAG: hypothetical protein AUJ50_01770 [Candidatus Aenigmarchaeota archaeon CG1_02_38_14]PIW40970.1 MAG: hypothetical protein COW21_04340 [Candidatus Aenigmarchaeota archaeon CG15_BIG_FIL_POST_REV_8_21_14_020_37_27]PIX50413.1 MAG: hypothetical protein COZ52_04285 [Candidatus Aenigmarchaeota archaeon CG_4_8_14_3_um_filter_37_24]PIY36395.1 MAG: hypothetical protein COZ04_00460 [Candidatus Aenigmarchaeota archaeon 